MARCIFDGITIAKIAFCRYVDCGYDMRICQRYHGDFSRNISNNWLDKLLHRIVSSLHPHAGWFYTSILEETHVT